MCLLLAALALMATLTTTLLAGCQMTQSPYARAANNAGSAFAAASVTLAYAHKGKISYAYAAASFVNYRSELVGLDQQITSASGAPNAHTVQRLLLLYIPAMRAIEHPCLASSCDWRTQANTLDQASQAFLKAGSS